MSKGHALAREELVRTLTAYSGVTTADGASDGSSLIDSGLIGKNDFLTGKSILIMSGDAEYETEGISAFSTTTGEITFAGPLSAQIVAGVSFRVLNTLPESVHITSGQVQIQGWDYESGEWRKVRVTASGEIAIHVTVADIVTAKISGQTVALQSGTGPILAKVSGETVIAKVSGETVIAKVSGETVSLPTSQVVKVSGETVIAKVSGETIVSSVSGNIVIAKISGETVIAKISGETVIAKISGEAIDVIAPTAVKTGALLTPTAASGGTVVTSGAVKAATFKSLSGEVFLGGATSGQMPYSNYGFLLAAGEAVSLDIDNFGRARICAAEHSGDMVSYIGVN